MLSAFLFNISTEKAKYYWEQMIHSRSSQAAVITLCISIQNSIQNSDFCLAVN